MATGPNQTRDQSVRAERLEADVTLLARAVSHLLRIPGREGTWTTADFTALRDLLERRYPVPEPERGDEPYVAPTDWENQPAEHDDLSRPAQRPI